MSWEWIVLRGAAIVAVVLAAACSGGPVPTPVREEMMSQDLTIWLTPEGEAAYKAAYDATLTLWPVPYEDVYVPTRYGVTHMVAAGPDDAPPLLLLHAVNNSATEWYANVGDLSRTRRVYAIDGIGDAGKSVPTRLPQSGREYAEWLSDVLDRLGLASVDIVGHSYGGWITLNTALYAPQRVQRIVLLAPSRGIAPFHRTTDLFLALAMKVRLPITPSAASILRTMLVKGHKVHPLFVQQMEMKIKHWSAPLIAPEVLADEELQQIKVPTLLLIGREESLYDPQAAVDRATRLMPDVRAELIPDASHLLPTEQPEAVDARISAFLGE
jgi:pimeloyl-ACP methyl ester carboxylesterase